MNGEYQMKPTLFFGRDKTEASYTPVGGGCFKVTLLADDGFEQILSAQWCAVSEGEAERACIAHCGGADNLIVDPNARLKEMGMVFIDGCYRMPRNGEHA